jgi:predicted HTH domain antitoxin
MSLQVEVPEDIELALRPQWTTLSRHLVEQLAADGFEQGLLSLAQVGRMLGLKSRWEAQTFLGERGIAVFDLPVQELDREADLHKKLATLRSPE